MPTYVYKCPDAHYKEVLHRMLYSTSVLCDECNLEMHKVPQAVGVVWGGLPPHQEHMIGPAAHDLLDNKERNRESLIAKQEARGKYIK